MSEPRDKYSGMTLSAYFACVADELSVDAVGMWQIVPNGRHGFALEGGELTEFVRRYVLLLLERGAKPVIGGAGTNYYWLVQSKYGEKKEDIVDAVIAEWLDAGGGDPDFDCVWFALPEIYETTKIATK